MPWYTSTVQYLHTGYLARSLELGALHIQSKAQQGQTYLLCNWHRAHSTRSITPLNRCFYTLCAPAISLPLSSRFIRSSVGVPIDVGAGVRHHHQFWKARGAKSPSLLSASRTACLRDSTPTKMIHLSTVPLLMHPRLPRRLRHQLHHPTPSTIRIVKTALMPPMLLLHH